MQTEHEPGDAAENERPVPLGLKILCAACSAALLVAAMYLAWALDAKWAGFALFILAAPPITNTIVLGVLLKVVGGKRGD
jgi:hypothetical protein